MSAQNNGGPAFPLQLGGQNYDGKHLPQDGMTMRDYFAAKAMQSLILNQSSLNGREWEHITAGAYQMADAMLAARDAVQREKDGGAK